MKKITFALAFLVSALFAHGQHKTLETEIRKLEETERRAMLERDTATLLKMWAPDFIANTPANKITHSRQELFDLMRGGIFNFSSFERGIESIFVKDNVVITMGNETVVPIGNHPDAGKTISRRFTNIWFKQHGQWKLTARHANQIYR